MKNSFFTFSLILFLSFVMNAQQNKSLSYPETKKGNVVDTYFNTEVEDPYRWLEDDRSPETEAWVKQQNQFTQSYLQKIPYRDALKNRLTEIWNYETVSAPVKEGDYYYFRKNTGLQNQYVIFRFKEPGATPELFLDPNAFSKDGTVSLGSLEFTKDGSLAAYTISEGGSDWRKVLVMDTKTRKIIGDTLTNVKFSGTSWKGNEGFYYSSYDKPEGSELSAKTDQHKLYFHKLGTSQKEDQVLYGSTPDEKHRYVGGYVTEDQQYLVLSLTNNTSGNKLYIKELNNDKSDFVPILPTENSDTYVITSEGSTLYLMTNLNSPNYKVVKTDIKNPSVENWIDVIPEKEQKLTISIGGGFMFAEYMYDAISKVFQYDHQGKLIKEIELPGIGSVSGFGGTKEDTIMYYNFTNYYTPSSIYSYNLKTQKTKLYRKSKSKFDSDQYTSKQVFYTSKDGTKIPMIITHKKGIELNGKNPTMLYGYGGFNISLTPAFSISNSLWMEQGGILAVPNLRGGGEYGKKWHLAGTKMKKQNVFDDFIAAGEYLIQEKYTSKEFLAIRGGSNGGLLVGAVMTQRPDLMQVALPAVGVLDMLRYHTFTAGAGWAYDYGTAEDSKEMFDYLKKYSPVHAVKKTAYPATLVTTGDHDDRVVPAHSFKFAATLQEHQTGEAPVLIRIETDAGHGAGTPTSKTIEQYADIFGFTLYNMGFKELPVITQKLSQGQ
ncbi:prolyl oligopeptidase family serine peptidase [Aquimarina sp. ERC-38]|uniref:prolyl oligopeptidase family serine peptidase n=1 Tax=Aquimarina sp. ERC-38 TaxID=2949996 RepID=UPI0022482A95|nr:prolyl oligopeptidase family serine peptidase [Aquimarina sp. ERC-38]UZO81745.1 prolyl oligopeptidase family serine peptidase [Aquimarina sp. ERC-38]